MKLPRETLLNCIKKIFWGYFLVLLNINFHFGSALVLPLLPNCLGWWKMGAACRQLADLRPSLGLLPPFCAALGLWNLLQFFPTVEAAVPGVLSLVAAIVGLYTNFQLLTDLARLAGDALPASPLPGKLRTARTVVVVTTTAIYCYDLMLRWPAIAAAVIAVDFCASLYILFQLHALRRALESPEGEDPSDQPPPPDGSE